MDKLYVEQRTIFATITGSHAYGLATKDSDTDIRGIAVMNNPEYYFGIINKFEQYEYNKEDTVIYDIRKALLLMANSNPNMIELLYIPRRFWIKSSPEWENIVDNRDKFLCRDVRYKYVGYAFSQLKRIKTARSWLLNPPKKRPQRSDYGLLDKKIIPKKDLEAFKWVLANLLKNTISYLNFSELTKCELENVNWIGLLQSKGISDNYINKIQKITNASDEWMEVMKCEQEYNNAKKYYNSYLNWKNNRNKKRAILENKYGYDTKHAMHLVRLMRMGEEIISSGKVKVFRSDRDELLSIRNGAWSYEKIEEYATIMEKKIISLYSKSTLPKEPDKVFISNLCVNTIKNILKE